MRSTEWMEDALCKEVGVDLFYAPDRDDEGSPASQIILAKRVCRMCPVLAECRGYALATREPHGVWGGMSEREREQFWREHDTPSMRVDNEPSAA